MKGKFRLFGLFLAFFISVQMLNAQGPTVLIQGQYNGTTIKTIKVASDGTLLVSGSFTGGNDAASATGSAVPAKADYLGVNIGGTLRGQTGANPSGSIFSADNNLVSINGVTLLAGAGNTGTGSPRVTIASDQAKLPVAYSDGTSLLPTDVAAIGGNSSGATAQYKNCDTPILYDTNTNGKTQLVALSSSQVVYVCGLSVVNSSGSAVTVSFGSGTGTNCGSTYTAKTPAWVLPSQSAAAVQGLVLPNSGIPWFKTASSEELCISTNAGVSLQVIGMATKF